MGKGAGYSPKMAFSEPIPSSMLIAIIYKTTGFLFNNFNNLNNFNKKCGENEKVLVS